RRRLPPWLSKDVIDAANGRLKGPEKAEPSNEADWDRFATINASLPGTFGGGGYNLFRLTAQLVRATEYFQRGATLPLDQVFELLVRELPQLDETDKSVPKAWHLLMICGCDEETLRKCYLHLLDAAGSVKTEKADVTGALPELVKAWLSSS